MLEKIHLTKEETLSPEFIALCKSIKAKRSRIVIDHILKHGFITNEDLSDMYGYDHPPRASQDVRDRGIPLITHKIVSPKTGRKIGAYTFGDVANIKGGRIGGRKAFPKSFKAALIKQYGEKDFVTGEALNGRYLQIDHRIPYAIAGEDAALDVANFMLLDASSQRTKSWSCEGCLNFLSTQDPAICLNCFWAYPENYQHVAMEKKRRIDLVWSDEEVDEYECLKKIAESEGMDIRDWIKSNLSKK